MRYTRPAITITMTLLALTTINTTSYATTNGNDNSVSKCILKNQGNQDNLSCGDMIIRNNNTTGLGTVSEQSTTIVNHTGRTLYEINGNSPATLQPGATYTLGDGHYRLGYSATQGDMNNYQDVEIYRNNPEDGDFTTNCLGSFGNPGFGCTTDFGGPSGEFSIIFQ